MIKSYEDKFTVGIPIFFIRLGSHIRQNLLCFQYYRIGPWTTSKLAFDFSKFKKKFKIQASMDSDKFSLQNQINLEVRTNFWSSSIFKLIYGIRQNLPSKSVFKELEKENSSNCRVLRDRYFFWRKNQNRDAKLLVKIQK